MTIRHLGSQRPPVVPAGLLQVIILWASSHGCWLHQAPKVSPAIKGFHLVKSDPYRIIPLSIITSNQIVWDFNYIGIPCTLELPRWLSGKESTCQPGDLGLIPGLGRSPGEGNGNLLQHSCLGNPRNRGACQFIVHGVSMSLQRVRLDWACNQSCNLTLLLYSVGSNSQVPSALKGDGMEATLESVWQSERVSWCYLLEVLLFYISHLESQSTWNWFLCEIKIKIYFYFMQIKNWPSIIYLSYIKWICLLIFLDSCFCSLTYLSLLWQNHIFYYFGL